jgi:hypothetical protein
VKASVFPLSTVVSHLLTSVDRNAVVTDEQWACLFSCCGYDTSTL